MSDKNEALLSLQRIYLQRLDYQAPEAPAIFRDEWQPKINLDLRTENRLLEEGVHEVSLKLKVTAKSEEKTVFVIEVDQSGIFSLQGFSEEQMDHILGAYCPSVLYPYARQIITDTVNQGSFPQLLLAPINFDTLYIQNKEQQTKQ
jgi:preprotein translocase subunit SecB